MEYYEIEDYQEKKLNKKKLIKTIVIGTSLLIFIVLFAIYVGNAEFRGWIDKYILHKEITESAGNIITISQDDNPNIWGYDNNIVILRKNLLEYYNSSGYLDGNISVNISNPIFKTNGKYLCLAEKDGNKIYLISGKNIVWQKDIEGTISNVNVNKNGHVSVIVTGTTHKAIVYTYDNVGNPLPTVYLSSTHAMDTDISQDNKQLAIAEINSAGNVIQSSIRIIDLDIAKENASEAEIYRYSSDAKDIITSIKYQNDNVLSCMMDNKIVTIKEKNVKTRVDFEAETTFADIHLDNYFMKINKKTTGIFTSESNVEITNVNNEKLNLYKLEGVPKNITTYNDVIGINLGTEVHFIRNKWMACKKIYFYKGN